MTEDHQHQPLTACDWCGTPFLPASKRHRQKYCSGKCKQQSWYHRLGGDKRLAERNKRPEVAEYRRLQVRLYKARHPDKVAEWTTGYRENRNKRVAAQSDGTAGRMISALMKLATCQYCGRRFNDQAEKRIDHRTPISLGGCHSAANLEVCCSQCNITKAAKPFVDWVSTLPEPFKSRAITRAEKASGATIHQHTLPLFVQLKP